MPDNSDMIAEAMKYLFYYKDKQNMQLIILKLNILCPSILNKSLTRDMELTGIVLLAKISVLL